MVRRIKSETDMAVTLSLGERDQSDLRAWREAGADRYLLRFESSNRELYARVHPGCGGPSPHRLEQLATLRRLGYEVGSGVMVGLPGQSHDDLAEDLLWFRRLDLDMIGVGPFIPHPHTPLGRAGAPRAADQVAPDELTTCKVIALARLLCPGANIPSTSALAALNPHGGRESGLRRGANVVMPNFTPRCYREMYDVYPGKGCAERWESELESIKRRIRAIGRIPGTGRGDSPRFRCRMACPAARAREHVS
jgi:biotin synthase